MTALTPRWTWTPEEERAYREHEARLARPQPLRAWVDALLGEEEAARRGYDEGSFGGMETLGSMPVRPLGVDILSRRLADWLHDELKGHGPAVLDGLDMLTSPVVPIEARRRLRDEFAQLVAAWRVDLCETGETIT